MSNTGHRSTHPEYLDDDGTNGVQFVRRDLAETEDEARAYIIAQCLFDREEDVQAAKVDRVWMKPVGDGPRGNDEWYSVVPDHEGVVCYWRLTP